MTVKMIANMYQIRNIWLITALATIGGLIQGFDVSSLSAIIGTEQYKIYFHNPNSVTQGGVTAAMAGGSLLGALFSTVLSDKYGRRDSMSVGCVIFVVGSILMAAVQNLAMLIIARIVNGFAVGILTSQGPLLLAELALPNVRGRMITIQQWNITWGILIMYFVSYGTSFINSTASFRLPWGLQMIPAIILLICLPSMPRSPRWLASRDRWEEAVQVLADIHAKGDKLDPRVIAEVQEIREKMTQDNKPGLWSDLLKRENFIRFHTSVFTHIWSQYTGQNAMMYYIVYIFQMAGVSGNQTLLTASIQYVIQVIMILPALLFIDRWPRRWVMMTGSLLLAGWSFAVGGLMASYGHAVPGGLNGVSAVTWVVPDKNASRGIIACCYLFVATYATTWGPVGWVYPPEIIPFPIRSKVVSVATAANWAMNFSLTFFTPVGFQNIQWKVYCIFGTFCLAGFLHVFLLFQETRGKSLEEMDDVFQNESIWAFKVNTQLPTRFDKDVKNLQQQAKAKREESVAECLENIPDES